MTNFADIDFDEINDATNLAVDEIKCLKVGFCLKDNFSCKMSKQNRSEQAKKRVKV